MSTSNPIDSAEIGASNTVPISVDEDTEQIEKEAVLTGSESKKSKRKTSKVWNDVKEVVDENGRKCVQCNHCNATLSISKGVPPTTYQRHIDACAERKNKIARKGPGGVQGLLSFDPIGSGSLSAYKYDKEAIKDVTAKMIMVHEYHFMMVEHKLFRIHNKLLNPKYEPFGRLAIRDRAMKLYVEEKEKMKVILANAGKISLTSDLWTSNQTKGYMCITGHFLDADWKLQNRILNFCLLPPPHSGVAIADKMYACLSEWGIENKISTITFDNAPTNDAAIRSLKEQFQGRDALYFGGKIFHVRCCAHILNLLVQDGLAPVKPIIENVRESVKFITLSPSRLHKWNEVVKNMCLPTNKSLILDCITRWNSTFHMLERALIFKDAFPRYASRDPSYCTLPSEEEWERARDVCKFLYAFDRITNIFSGREFTTSNLYFPEIWKIRQMLDDMAHDPRDFMKLMVQRMKEKFDKYWKECNLFMIIACVLDPRNKIALVKYVFTKLYHKDEVDERLAAIRDEMHILYDDYVAKERSAGSDDIAQVSIGGTTENVDTDTQRKEFESWFRTDYDVTMTTRKELDIYLDESVLLGGGKDFDVLCWWKSMTLKYPILSKMARDVLSIPVTTVPSESAFSAGRRIISDDRCSLGDDTVEGLLCASNWFRVAFQGV